MRSHFLGSIPVIFFILLTACRDDAMNRQGKVKTSYEDLQTIFRDWRDFERPPLKDGAPDYSKKTFEKRWPVFQALQRKLREMDTTGWTIPQQVDYRVVLAEMNGYDFNHRVLKPWERDPAFYKSLWMERSDVPAHEGTTHHGITELWTYPFPLDAAASAKLLKDLQVIPPLNRQARENLTGDARELWIAGIRDIRSQSEELKQVKQFPGISSSAALVEALDQAIRSTDSLATWLESESPKKKGPSGIGRENYTWYIRNVHLVPMTWEDEAMLMKRELSRAWTALKLEEHRNRSLPPLPEANTPEAYDSLASRSARNLMSFLQQQEMVTVKDYFEPALREHLGGFVPKERRNFFQIGSHIDPRPLYSHFYHWFELARMDREPHANTIRRGPLLYNIFDNRNEGLATAVEEMFMQAGLYDNTPRVREIVYIMIAQRAARGLGSLYAHANEMTMEEAGGIHTEYTPRGWMKTEKELRMFEQHLYLRQPGYGTSYITGKYLLENALAEMARMQEAKMEPFRIGEFMDRLNAIGCIPVSLVQWEITGIDPMKGFVAPK